VGSSTEVWRSSPLAELLGHVYRSPIDPDGWPEAMRLIAQGIHAPVAGIHVHAPDGRDASTIAAFGEPPPSAARRYQTYDAERNPWLRDGASKLRSGAVVTGDELCSEDALIRSELYNDFLRPLRLRHAIFAILDATPEPLTYLLALRPPGRKGFGNVERRRLSRLLPHLMQAMRIHAKLEATLSHERTASEIMDRLPLGIFLLDARGRVVQMNAAARTIVDRADALRLDRGVLVALETRADVQLQRMIFGAGAAGSGRNLTLGGTCTLPRSKGGHPLSAMIAPTGVTGIFPSSRRASVVVLVEEPVQRPPLPFVLFSKSFKLSHAEALLAQRLLTGLSLRQAADDMGIRESTARSHLKRVFAKTGARRQSDLILRALTHDAERPPTES
jgi:DNA-binding CsgD family transcriptional regulator/PAS domain-containing protein